MKNLLLCAVLAVVCQFSLSNMIISRKKRNDANLRVASLKVFPYFMEKGPGKYEGFMVDLISGISNITRQVYTLYPVHDSKYGKLEGSTWTGLIGEIVQGKAEIAAAPITISNERKDVVSFTEPFETADVMLVLRKPAEGMPLAIKSPKDLVDQTVIKPIAIRDGTTHLFFRTSSDLLFRKIGENLAENELVANNEDGIKKVRDGNFGMLMESPSADYWVNKKPCDLVAVKIVGDDRKYALAVSKGNDDLNRKLSDAIRQMKNDKSLDALKAKWWVHECSGSVKVVAVLTTLVVSIIVSLT